MCISWVVRSFQPAFAMWTRPRRPSGRETLPPRALRFALRSCLAFSITSDATEPLDAPENPPKERRRQVAFGQLLLLYKNVTPELLRENVTSLWRHSR